MPIKNQIIKVTLTSFIAAIACASIIQAATTIGTNITTGGTLSVTGASTLTGNTTIAGTLSVTGDSTFTTASSTGIVKFSQINSDTGSINFGDDNIYTTGNVGIGTSSPYAKLSVVGEVVASYFTATSTTATSSIAGIFSIGSTTPFSGAMFSIGTSTSLFYVDKNTGYIGIGTTSPTTKFSVSGSITSSGSAGRITGTNGFIDFNDLVGIKFDAGSDGTDLFIDSSLGAVSIGTETLQSASKLTLEGTNDGDLSMVTVHTSTAQSSDVVFKKTNGGSSASPTETTDGHILGQLKFSGVHSSSAFIQSARIKAMQDGTASATNVPAEIVFQTGTDSASPADALTIKSDKVVVFAPQATFPTCDDDGAVAYDSDGNEGLCVCINSTWYPISATGATDPDCS